MARTITSADYFEADSAVVTAAPFTINCWFNPTNVTQMARLVSIVDKDVGDQIWALWIRGDEAGDPVKWTTFTGTEGTANSTAGFTAGAWQMATGVEAASDSRAVFLDGGNKGTNATDLTVAGADRTSVGRTGDSTPTASDQNVTVAEISIWNVALSDAEIASLYTAGPIAKGALFVRPGSLVAYWRCLEQAITDDLQDIVGGLHLTQTSSPAIADHPPTVYPGPQLWLPAGASKVPIFMDHYRRRRAG